MKIIALALAEGWRITLLASVMLLVMLFAIAELGSTGFIYVKF